MPIRPDIAEPLVSLLTPEECDAANLLQRSLGLDVAQDYRLWERVVARLIGGECTEHRCAWDVQIPDYLHGGVRVEVKSASECAMRFRVGTRQVFRFADPFGGGRPKDVDVLVLVGIDAARMVYAWAIPACDAPHGRAITLTSPRVRVGHGRSGLDRYACPPTQLLPETLRAYRGHHAQTRARTIREARESAGQATLDV